VKKNVAVWVIGFAVWACAMYGAIRFHERFVKAPAPSSSASSSASPAPPVSSDPDYFDFAKRDRETDWCLAHGGVPTMTFTHAHSNVLCLDPRAVIPLPAGK